MLLFELDLADRLLAFIDKVKDLHASIRGCPPPLELPEAVSNTSREEFVAKVARDALMVRLAQRHPGYGWERNAGYGTAAHLAALDRLGYPARETVSA